MRLIDTITLELVEFRDDTVPKYAILSHTWEDDEVTFQDWHDHRTAKGKKGYVKIAMACRKAQKHRLRYLWVDTNCIDKSSSAELSEAINSMFSWYRRASICYVYLADVESMPDDWEYMTEDYVKKLRQSKWFTRGWTLQELLAPTAMNFYSQDWSKMASRSTLASVISERTHISLRYLQGDGQYKDASIAQKMSWVSQRLTTRIEDMAYCMLGIFDIHMPLLYGEGPKAFTRLQEEIIRTSNDQTIFCWTWIDSVPPEWASLLAPCPEAFKYSEKFVMSDYPAIPGMKMSYKITNSGLSIDLPIVQTWSYYLGILNVGLEVGRTPANTFDRLASVPIQGYLDAVYGGHPMRRHPFPPGPVCLPPSWRLCQSRVYIRSTPGPADGQPSTPSSPGIGCDSYSFLLIFGDTEKLLVKKLRRRTMKSEISPGTRICLMENTRCDIKLDVFPPGVFDQERSLVTLDRPFSPKGFLIRIENCALGSRVLFIGMGTHSQRLYRTCDIVPESMLSETPNEKELLTRLLDSVEQKRENQPVSSRYGIEITIREEAMAGIGLICLTYITCKATNNVELAPRNAEDVRSDTTFEIGRNHKKGPRMYRRLLGMT